MNPKKGDPHKPPDQPGSYVKMSFARANLRATGEYTTPIGIE